MRYNRHDYFRYQFTRPLPAVFRIQMTASAKMSNSSECEIIDLSTGGAKLFTFLELPVQSELATMQLEFKLIEEPLILTGEIAWKRTADRGYEYGMQFEKDAAAEAIMIAELKQYARQERFSAE